MRRGRFRWRTFAVAMVLSLAFHYGYLIPRVLAPLVEKPDVPMEIAIDPPPSSDSPSEPDKQQPPKPEKARPEIVKSESAKELSKPPEPAKVEPPKQAEVEPQRPVEAKPVPPPPPPPKMDHRMQMVDQDKFPDEADNNEARYLAQKNHKAAQDTRTDNTNLIREVESKNTQATEESQNRDKDVGGKDDRIAELENRDGQKNALPRSSPMRGDEGTKPNAEEKPGPLSMRDLTPRSEVKARDGQKPREGPNVEDQQEEGDVALPLARIGRDSERGHTAQKGGKIKLTLTLDHHNYDNIEGYGTAEKERREAAMAQSSHKKGRYDKYLAAREALRSSIENFTPEVRTGNQAELGTRASPFAAYITAMHRQIHKLFTFGFLSDIDLRNSGPYADQTLWTQLEIVLKGDGNVDKVSIVRSSGVLAFDVAAIDSVMSAAPFPTPPQVIKSANGKVYMDWQFHRDERACGTFGVDPYILTTPGDKVEHDTSETGANAKEMYARAHEGKPAPQQREAPRTLEREPPKVQEREHESNAPSVRPAAPTVIVPEVTPEVRSAAEGWFAAYARGDAAWLAGWSATPFTAAGEVVARDGARLKAIYKQLLAENAGSRKSAGLEVLTPAGIRGKLGGLPPGGEESGMLYAVGKAGSEEFILLLKNSDQGWRVCGVDR